MTRWLWSLASCVAALLFALPAGAHGKSVSYSRWELTPQGASVRLRVSKLDVSALALDVRGDGLTQLAPKRVTMWSGATRCRPSDARALPADGAWLAFEWSVVCAAGDRRIDNQLLFDSLPAHLHFAVVVEAAREREWLLTSRQRGVVTGESATPSVGRLRGVVRFVPFGARHVAAGLDHLVFLLVLALGASNWRRLAWLVSGFTLGHAVSSTLAVLGIVATSAPAVEALIAASIAVVAVENVWLRNRSADPRAPRVVVLALGAIALTSSLLGKSAGVALGGLALLAACYFAWLHRGASPERARLGLTTFFGLVHGLGFASGMRGLGLAKGRMLEALVGFNLGIELAQLAILAAAALALVLARRASRRIDAWALSWGSAAALACACFWLLPRALG